MFGDFPAEARDDVCVPWELEQDIREERRGCVAACEKDVEEFGADARSVCGLGEEFFEEDVAGGVGGGFGRFRVDL